MARTSGDQIKKQWDSLWINGLISTCDSGYGLIENAGIAINAGKIAWVGPLTELSAHPDVLATRVYDLHGACVTPGLIDCHTHLIYGGNRANEFEQRLQGVSYEQIAERGGGIQSSVSATRAATEDELFALASQRAHMLLANGVTTLEIKSGYGLDWETELKLLRVAKRLQDCLPMTIQKTFLGAHIVPSEYQGRADDYIDVVCQQMIPVIAKEKLADAVDVFCEKIAFNLAQTERVFAAAKQHNLAIKCHAEQLSDMGAAQLAAKYHALSVDHLEHVSQEGVKAIADSGTTAVLLPGAYYFLQQTTRPPIDLLRQYHVSMAIATDCNPGTSPIFSPLLIMNMACVLFGFTPEEALLAVTRHAASAMGLEQTHGSLTVGRVADFAVWKINHPVELAYHMGCNPLGQLIRNGHVILSSGD